MKLNIEPIRSWFGFTRRERSASFILLVLILLSFVLRYIIPDQNITIEDISSAYYPDTIPSVAQTVNLSDEPELFTFDPNRVSYDTLIELGLTTTEANRLINYRNKGGKFRNPSEIKKIYGIEEKRANDLIPYVRVGVRVQEPVVGNSSQRSVININTCDSATLATLPGIGPVLSVRIIKYRNLLGGFARVEQLKEVYGLPEETFSLIEGRFTLDSLKIRMINVNLADYKELIRMPYFEKYEVSAILKYRELEGRIDAISELTENKLISEEKAYKLKPYLSF